jgi:hypothetical protein
MRVAPAACAVCAFVAAAQSAPEAAPAPVQPLPFSHRIHASNGLACSDCHAMPAPGDQAGFPATSRCMACHVAIARDRAPIVKLAEFDKRQEPIPWKRVYRVPPYVVFSHKTHVGKGHASCQTCHGPVQERDTLRKEKPTSMSACVDCHKDKGAPVTCDYCHETQ